MLELHSKKNAVGKMRAVELQMFKGSLTTLYTIFTDTHFHTYLSCLREFQTFIEK